MIDLRTTGSKPIGIIGNLNIDLTIRNVSRMPDWGQEVFGENYESVPAGQAAKTALELSHLGHDVKLVANVGDDLNGKEILNELKQGDINLDGVVTHPGMRTGISVAIVRPDGERAFVSDPGCLRQFTYKLATRNLNHLADCGLVCLLGIFFLPGISLPEVQCILRSLKASQKTTLLDTGWDAGNWQPKTIQELNQLLALTDVFIPNLDEASAITGYKDPANAAKALHQAGPGIVIIKLGAEGSYLFSKQIQQHVPALKVKVVDAVGAGDVFNAGFIHAYLQDWPLPACVQFGNATASLYVSRRQDRFPGLNEVVRAANQYNEYRFI